MVWVIIALFALTALRIWIEIKLTKIEQEKYRKRVLSYEKNRVYRAKRMGSNTSRQCDNN